MCLAIFKPKGVKIKKKYLRNGWDQNEDGGGFAIVRDGAVEIHKGFFTFKSFYSEFSKFNDASEVAIIHFRFATHGLTNYANCHPFSLCGKQYGMIHNGVIDIECHDKALSDTHHFAELVLQPMLEKGIEMEDGAFRYLVEEAIGSLNKIVLLRGDGSHVIYNEKQGEWKNGSWYSNGGYKWTGGFASACYSAGKVCGGSYAAYSGPYGSRKGEVEEYAPSDSCEGYGSEWEYKHDPETKTWKRSEVQKRLAEMSEEEWKRECEEELARCHGKVLTQAEMDEENTKYCA